MNDAQKDDLLFQVLTPIGFQVRVTRAYWELIISIQIRLKNENEYGPGKSFL
jgi:hypothetical protein